MMKKMDIEVEITLKLSQFKQDFLEIEVLKDLAIYGDDLLLKLKDEYQEDAKKYGKLFSRYLLYYVKSVRNNKVKLVGVYI